MKRHKFSGVKGKGDAGLHRPDFDDLALMPSRRISAAPAALSELDELIGLAQRLIPPLAAAEPSIRAVFRHNPDSVWAVRGSSGLCGVFAMLLLNRSGERALLAGALDAAAPELDFLIRPGERAAAVYLWAIATPGFAVDAFRIVSLWLRSAPYSSADIYTRVTTPRGTQFAINIGFKPMRGTGLYRFRRHRNRAGAAIAVA